MSHLQNNSNDPDQTSPCASNSPYLATATWSFTSPTQNQRAFDAPHQHPWNCQWHQVLAWHSGIRTNTNRSSQYQFKQMYALAGILKAVSGMF
jgi:recombinational DNA repair protein (RecF pathway)